MPAQLPEPDDAGPHGRGARAAAFFDVDNTIVRGASAFHLMRELRRRGFFSVADILFFVRHGLAYLLSGEDPQRMGVVRDRALRIMQGRSVAEILSIAESVYDEVLESTVFPGTRKLLDHHVSLGHEVWLVTAGPQEIGQLVALRLGATGAVGTVAEKHDGIYTGRLVGETMHGAAKAAAARTIAEREGFDLAECFAYGDSVHDIPILESVGHPCAVNPEPRLRMHCADVGWPVRDFRRRRSSLRRKVGTTAGTVGVAWAVGLAVRSVVRRLRSPG